MANAIKINIEEDGPRNVVAKTTIICDTSNLASTTVLDPTTLNATNPPTNLLAIQEIQYSVQDGWVVELFWDATTPKRIVSLTGRGIFPVGPNYGGIQNNAGVGVNGKITVQTIDYTSGTMYATFILHCVKQTDAEVAAQSGDVITTQGGDPLTTEAGVELVTE